MKIKVALLDFDGTLVTKDILDVICQAVGKEEASRQLNESFNQGQSTGLEALIKRINFLKGVTKSQIFEILQNNSYLMAGAEELMDFFQKHNIITILASGNIMPVLEFYQEMLSIDFIVGSKPKMDGDTIFGISESDFTGPDFKLDGIKQILKKLNVSKQNIIAIGDSPSDKGIFSLSGCSIAINPKGNIAQLASYVIRDDLKKAISLLD